MSRAQASTGVVRRSPAGACAHPIGMTLLTIGMILLGHRRGVHPCCRSRPFREVDLPTIEVSAALPGAEPGNHGIVGGNAAWKCN